MKQKKPNYGWYVRNLIAGFIIIGLFGFVLLLFGLMLKPWINIPFLIVGIMIIILFLWPGIGMMILNLNIGTNFSLGEKMNALESINAPFILDVGCGTGRTAISIAKMLKNGGHLIGIDIYNKSAIGGNSLKRVQENAKIEGVELKAEFQYGSAIDIPFENENFDIVNFSSVLHELHMKNGPDLALKEAYRVLKPGGFLYVGEWSRNAWQLILYTGIFCFVFKSKKYWEQLFLRNNFTIESYNSNGGFIIFSLKK